MNYIGSFNSNIELGTRITLVLTAIERAASLNELVMLDYALLYSEEFGGPKNLHPALPNHIAEIAHRRESLPKAIDFLLQRGLVTVNLSDSGSYFESTTTSLDYVSCLQSSYYKKAWRILSWLKNNVDIVTKKQITELMEQ